MFNSTYSNNVTGTVERFKQELDKLVDMTWSQGEKALEAFKQFRPEAGSLVPAVDLINSQDSLVLVVDLPGLTAEEVELTLIGNVLTIRTATPELHLQEGDQLQIRERPVGKIERTVALPVPVNAEQVQAEMKNGTLRISMQKATSARSIQIAVHGDTHAPAATSY